MQRFFSLFILGTFLFTACDDTTDVDTSDCGSNGYWDADHGHCHCDSGYQLSDDGSKCTADEEDDDGETDATAFSPDSVEATLYNRDDGSSYWVLLAKDGKTWLSIENYPDYGGATGPESRTISEADADYATCGVCVLLRTECESHGDHAHCGSSFMPEPGGEISFDAFGEADGELWSGSLTDVRLVEVEINAQTFETTPVTGGETILLDDWSFEATLQEQ